MNLQLGTGMVRIAKFIGFKNYIISLTRKWTKIKGKDTDEFSVSILKIYEIGEEEKKPILIKEILCEYNEKMTHDYGPGYVINEGNVYFFKRIYPSNLKDSYL